MSSTCDLTEARIRRFLGQGLGAEEREALREHLSGCESCREGYRTAVETTAALGAARREERVTVARALSRERWRPSRLMTAAASGRHRRPGQGFRTLVYPCLIAALLFSLSRSLEPQGARLHVETGTVRAGASSVEDVARLRQGSIIRTEAGSRARLDGGQGRAILQSDSSVLVERTRSLRLRLVSGCVNLEGPSVVVVPGRVLELDEGGKAKAWLSPSGLAVEMLDGDGRISSPLGTRELSVGAVYP